MEFHDPVSLTLHKLKGQAQRHWELSRFSPLVTLLNQTFIRTLKVPPGTASPDTELLEAMWRVIQTVESVMMATKNSEYLREIDSDTGNARVESLVMLDSLHRTLEQVLVTALQYNVNWKRLTSGITLLYKMTNMLNHGLREFARTSKLTWTDGLSNYEILERLSHCSRLEQNAWATFLKAYLPQTCEDLISNLEAWVSGNTHSSKKIAHLTGGAFTGKSTIAAEMRRRLHERGQLGAYFFCGGWFDSRCRSLYVSSFFLAMAAQLGQHQPSLAGVIAGAVRREEWLWGHGRENALQVPFLDWVCVDLVRTALKSLGPRHPPVCIILDGLDSPDDAPGLDEEGTYCRPTWVYIPHRPPPAT
ncbi:hypothetical protein C8Q80DRAFT_174817 [Daedaleopsis nitida]|nr:hypothetical protein C8Q80DRAFT_174817 [Daedaleopsis nitida]